ncbi:MAG: FGGY family carbohydrate kinase [Balneolaceae bacterium]|nr:FGGY family carbohydrate kinase [Balneolaceae bacterium]
MSKKVLLGFDVGSSFVKGSVIDADDGDLIASASAPDKEMSMHSPQPGMAEQDPEVWWEQIKSITQQLLASNKFNKEDVAGIGISYQMHGLVAVDKDKNVLRSSIIWCDSRAASIGREAFQDLGEDFCLENYLNSPGNFTASKLKWVKDNEPKIYKKIWKIMLPGDYIGMKLTGEVCTTKSGLSEGIFWDYSQHDLAQSLLEHYGISADLLPKAYNSFDDHGTLSESAAAELSLKAGTPVSYRAGDQPNNAFSLNVIDPGEVAATAGTSGVIYGVIDKPVTDPKSRVNTFIHVNHEEQKERYGMLLCINGTGILNSWNKKQLADDDLSYDEMNEMAAQIEIGSEGLNVLPFGNGAERVLEDQNLGAHFSGIDFHRHTKAHMFRAAQEGIVFSLYYGLQIMEKTGIECKTVKAGHANMFLSPVFREAFVNTTGATLELYNTDGAQGAARGAGVGAGVYNSIEEAFEGLKQIETVSPNEEKMNRYRQRYYNWVQTLQSKL